VFFPSRWSHPLLRHRGRLYGLCSAVWSHGIGSGDPLHEVVLENISEACQPIFKNLERLGYEDIRTKVQVPKAILDEPGTPLECAGETWEYEIEPSLVAGERWIIRELARFGGLISVDGLMKFVRDDTVKRLKEWDDHIKETKTSNRDYMERLMKKATKHFEHHHQERLRTITRHANPLRH